MYECTILYYCILFIDIDYEECYGSKYTNSQYFMRQIEFLLAFFPPTKAQSPPLWIQRLMLYVTSVHRVCLFRIERPSTENLLFPLSLIIRNITEISQRQQMDREAAPSSPDAARLRPVKCYLKLPALGFLQQLMKSLHRAYIPGIMNSFWLMLLTKVYSCIQNISISSVGLGTDAKPGAPAGRYRQESIQAFLADRGVVCNNEC